MQYFVVMIDYGRRGREAVVDPEITRREVVSRIASGEYRNISFVHEIADCSVEDITADILTEAALPEIDVAGPNLQADQFDHIRDMRKQRRFERARASSRDCECQWPATGLINLHAKSIRT